MSIKNKDKNYQLVLEGLENDAPQTLQKVKGILIGNLELSISEVQNILENYPLTIKRSSTQSDLAVHFESLKSAGAKVLLLKEEDKPSNEIEFSLENPVSMESLNNKQTELPANDKENSAENEIEFEFDLDSISKSTTKEITEPEEAYELNINEDTNLSLKEIEEELGESLQLAEIGKQSTKDDGDADFSLDLQPAENGLDLIDSPALANSAEAAETWESDHLSESLVSQTASELLPPEDSINSNSSLLKIEESLFDLNKDSEVSSPASKVSSPAADKKTEIAVKKETINAEINSDLKLELEGVENETSEPVTAIAEDLTTGSNTEQAAVEITAKPPEQGVIGKSLPAAAEPKTDSAIQEVQLKPAVKPVKNISAAKNKKNVPPDLLIPIIVGGLLLGVVNWFYFTSKAESKSEAQPKIIIPAKALENNKTEEVKPVPTEAPLHDYSGTFQNEQYSISLKLSASSDKVSRSFLEITSTKPAELSAEEIVQNVPNRIWLKKAEAENIKFEKNTDLPGQFQGNLNLKFYIEQGQDRQRLIGHGAMKLKISEEKAEAELIIFTNSSPENAENEVLKLDKNDQGQYTILFKKDIMLSKVIKTEASDIQPAPAAGENTKQIE